VVKETHWVCVTVQVGIFWPTQKCERLLFYLRQLSCHRTPNKTRF